jgi:hypothetical protein
MRMGIKCVLLMNVEIFRLFTFLCFRFMFFCNGMQRLVLIIHNISYAAISIKVVTETINSQM